MGRYELGFCKDKHTYPYYEEIWAKDLFSSEISIVDPVDDIIVHAHNYVYLFLIL